MAEMPRRRVTRRASRAAPRTRPGCVPWLRANLFAELDATRSSRWCVAGAAGLLAARLSAGLGRRCKCRRSRPDTEACRAVERRRRLLGRDRREVPPDPVRPLPVRRAVARRWSRPSLMVALLVASCMPRASGSRWLIVAWVVVLAVVLRADVRRRAGPDARADTTRWGGLPLTLHAVHASASRSPFRWRSLRGARAGARKLPAIRTLCVLYVELIRGVPLISCCSWPAFMFPLFMPEGMTIDVLLRVLVGITLFAAAYLAEVVRGGLQAMPQGPVPRPPTRWACPTGRRSARSSCRRRCALVVPAHREHLHRRLQGHLAGDHRQPLRPDRRAGPGAGATPTGGRSSSRSTSSSPRSTSSSASRCRATASGSRSGIVNRQQDPMQPHERSMHRRTHHRRSRRSTSGTATLPRAARHRPVGRQRRAHRDLRPVGLRQVDADPLHQPAGGAPGGHAHRRRHRADRRREGDRGRSAARSAWCSSSSTCSRT